MVEKETSQSWIALWGSWSFDQGKAIFTGPSEETSAAPKPTRYPLGLVLSTKPARRGGCLSVRATLPENRQDGPAARLVLGYEPTSAEYYNVGLGGYDAAFVLEEFHNRTHRLLHRVGEQTHLTPGRAYELRTTFHARRVTLGVDNVNVFSVPLPRPLSSDQVGLFAWSDDTVLFEDFSWRPQTGEAFVVMQFGEPFDSLYTQVIKPVCDDQGFNAERADDVYRPGAILQDITSALESADVVIAEISTANPNVFYEVGYAHARQTPTILLARREEQLPFDISGYRTIFYEDTIGGKDRVASDLRKHLTNIR